ncbi:MAG: NADH:ubiquinone oxidoreductase [Leptospiraceae bacterium]|nr:hypothetical protein [Leptospiraceae bacterium]MCP5500309.1 NADH:ubiquinone oxidoreductase [Leptospiraceae bacterium]
MPTIFWIQSGACSGDTMSFLNANDPNLNQFFDLYSIQLLWHPSLSPISEKEFEQLIEDIKNEKIPLDIFCVEGSILTGPEETGMFDTFLGRPKMEVVRELCEKANLVLAVGTCSSFGGIPAAPPNPTDAVGLQWFKDEPDGLFELDWRSKSGYPVINLAGCPVHPNTIVQTMLYHLTGQKIELDHLNRPKLFYNSLIHQGCSRNEYHEFDIEDENFGGRGCLFFNQGCEGPKTLGTCNLTLWNEKNSKPRAGVPCFGCTASNFPKDKNLFKTKKLGDIPAELPLGVNRANYLAYKGLAKSATPQRLKEREVDV